RLGTPIGPAAGPHTQLAQNIVCAWLSGGRFIELKTVQIMDELQIPRPCIDMEDEGYNVEWSQELKLRESADEYVKAWVLIHILQRVLGFERRVPFDTIFNMSVGYNLEGLQSEPMRRFMDTMADASDATARMREVLRKSFPQFADVEFSPRLSNSVTLSTMHGCPPDEIERIVRYLMEERGLHTTVKLNPTLLGKERVLGILHGALGFTEMEIPDSAFEQDLKYPRALELIATLKRVAAERKLTFGVKLSNTLAMRNLKSTLPGQEMYVSGRPLYPLTINLFNQLSRDFAGDLNVSYSAGADALNVTDILSCGARPVTVATDLLKPGGYSRFLQYLENLEAEMRELGAASLEELARDKLNNLEQTASEALKNPRYKKSYRPPELPKVNAPLELFDCITAPCAAKCPVHQDIPEYAWLIARGEYDRALEVILARNPLPGITGYVCTHVCQTRCTRSNYDEPVAIRALKRVAFEKGKVVLQARPKGDRKVAIIGAGPSGLAAASFLALNGVQVTIFEAKDKAGGMTNLAPIFRLPPAVIQQDVDRVVGLGVELRLSHPITTPPEELLKQGFDAVYVACGFPKDTPLNIAGIRSEGVYTSLEFLDKTARGERPALGSKVLIIGGGNTAMDAARTAQRLAGQPVTLVYRRTTHEMPADEEERADLIAEGNRIIELASPVRVIAKDGRVTALECVRNKLGEPGPDGRRKPVPVEGSNFRLEADAIIVAIGQSPDVAFLDGSAVPLRKDGAIAADDRTQQAGPGRVYAGGDAVRGPDTIIQACADGRQAAENICRDLGVALRPLSFRPAELSEEEITHVKRTRARKESQRKPERLPTGQRACFDLVEQTLTTEAARAEALRCLQCSTFCDKCVEVCPNRANLTYFIPAQNLTLPRLACRDGGVVVTGRESLQIVQTRQILHLDDLCNECGNCETFCVHQGKPYREKPRLFFTQSDFERENDNAFYIEKDATDRAEGGWSIRRRNGRRETRLTLNSGNDQMIFDNDWLRGSIALPGFELNRVELKQVFEGEFSLCELVEMLLVLRGVTTSMSFLPVG
ncbi:MAG: putative selenate reductase subunit YgfK, partial [bacterium]